MTLALSIPKSRVVVPAQERWKTRPNAWERLATPFDLNMAPFRYQKILKEDGGPIEHLERGRMQTPQGIFYNVSAYLVEHLRPTRRERSKYYGNADGGGTHLTELIARFMAVSEAIERWAFWDRVDSMARTVYGFDIDPTTTGMAAFPGLFHFRARRKARLEALERFGLLHWWEGRLGHRLHPADKDGCQVVEILVPGTAGAVVVVTFRDEPTNGTRSYGYGAGASLSDAVSSARIEMLRHQMVLRRFVECHPDPRLGLLSVQAHQERRALYFGLTEGKDLFDERLKCGPWGRKALPKTVFDGLVLGDWDRYASVWRALYEPPSEEYLSDRNDYFFW